MKPTKTKRRRNLRRQRPDHVHARLVDFVVEDKANLGFALGDAGHGLASALADLGLRLHLVGDAERLQCVGEAGPGRRSARRVGVGY